MTRAVTRIFGKENAATDVRWFRKVCDAFAGTKQAKAWTDLVWIRGGASM